MVLLGAAAIATGWEALAQADGLRTPAWHLPPAIVVGGALLAVLRSAESLRPAAVAAVSALLYLGFFAVHRHFGLPLPDADINRVYPRYGHALLDTGNLPRAEYPPGALLTFAAATALGRVAIVLPLLTLPLLVTAWWALASIRPRAAWIVACVALWPTLEFFWEVKFDAIPTALFVLGSAEVDHPWIHATLGEERNCAAFGSDVVDLRDVDVLFCTIPPRNLGAVHALRLIQVASVGYTQLF